MAKTNIKFNNKQYSIDSSLLAEATASLEAHFADMAGNPSEEERLEGDGSEYYTLAPTALSFRSTAPLNELQEVQINGVTVDPANYTLEEGSTIVTFPIEYLKTLNVGNYEVDVISDSKTVKGGFVVAAPELNEYGFYYNQPYTAYVDAWATKTVFFMREDGTADVLMLAYNSIEVCPYTISGNTITLTAQAGTFTAVINVDGIYCNEVATTFVLGDTSIAADDDYIYIYKEELDGYEVNCIDKTKSEYGAIKTGINGIDTVKLSEAMFANNISLVIAPKIPDNVTSIGEGAFSNCINLKSLIFTEGSQLQSIGASAFGDCISLSDIKLPDGIISIGSNAFSIDTPGYTSSLISIVIPARVTVIGYTIFNKCNSLETIVFKGTVEQWNAISFYGDSRDLGDVPATYVQCSDGQVAL